MPSQTSCCCCCSASTGLRVLGWWWVIYCILVLYYLRIPGVWVYTVCAELAIIPCFIVLLQMTCSDDHPKMRGRLHKTYLYFGVIFGLLSQFAATLYTFKNITSVINDVCHAFHVFWACEEYLVESWWIVVTETAI